MGFKCTACGTVYTAQHPHCGKCGSPFLAYTSAEEGTFWGTKSKIEGYGSDGFGSGLRSSGRRSKEGSYVGVAFFVVAALTAFIYTYLGEFIEHKVVRIVREKLPEELPIIPTLLVSLLISVGGLLGILLLIKLMKWKWKKRVMKWKPKKK